MNPLAPVHRTIGSCAVNFGTGYAYAGPLARKLQLLIGAPPTALATYLAAHPRLACLGYLILRAVHTDYPWYAATAAVLPDHDTVGGESPRLIATGALTTWLEVTPTLKGMRCDDAQWQGIITGTAIPSVLVASDGGHYTGLFLDNLFFDRSASVAWTNGALQTADGVDATNDAGWIAAMQAMLSAIEPSVSGAIIANGLQRNAVTTADSLTHYGESVEGLMLEGFAVDKDGAGGWVIQGDASWEAKMGTYLAAHATLSEMGVVCLTYCDSTDGVQRLYGLASYLLGRWPSDRAYYAVQEDEIDPTWLPELDLSLGVPVGSPTALSALAVVIGGTTIYRKGYTRGEVLVNPYNNTVTVPLRNCPHRLALTGGSAPLVGGTGTASSAVVSSIVLDPYTAAVMLPGPWRSARGPVTRGRQPLPVA